MTSYTKNGDSEELFDGLNIRQSEEFFRHLNKHNVISINFAKYFENHSPCDGGIELLSRRLMDDLKREYPDVVEDGMDLSLAFDAIQQEKGEKFIFLIDEWDSIDPFGLSDIQGRACIYSKQGIAGGVFVYCKKIELGYSVQTVESVQTASGCCFADG